MEKRLSRRGFMKKSGVALGAAVTCNLADILGPGNGENFTVLASEKLPENNSSHVSVKLWPGRSEQTKQRLAEAIVEDVVAIIGCDAASVSVSIEDVSSGNWKEEVYDPAIQGNIRNLYKKPGYSM